MSRRGGFWLAFLGIALVLALIPELFFREQEPQLVLPGGQGSVTGQGSLAELRSPEPLAEVPPQLDTPQSGRVPHADLFAAHSWYVAPPVPSAAVIQPRAAPVVAAPVAPPLPFRFLGSLDDSRQLLVFLQRGEQLYSVRAGDVIDGTYRVEKVQRSGMTLTYLPLRITQSLASGSEP